MVARDDLQTDVIHPPPFKIARSAKSIFGRAKEQATVQNQLKGVLPSLSASSNKKATFSEDGLVTTTKYVVEEGI